MKFFFTLLMGMLFFLSPSVQAQTLSLKDIKNYENIADLTSSGDGNTLAWTSSYSGKRNIFIAQKPNYKPKQITFFDANDEQEITSLQIDKNAQYAVYVRGGDHGGYLYKTPTNALSKPQEPNITIWYTNISNSQTKLLSEGDKPVLSPDGQKIAFLKNGNIWMTEINSSSPKIIVQTQGKCSDIQWSPDGQSIAFVSNRVGHSFIGIYTNSETSIRWIAPSFFFDRSPRWSPNGKNIAFIRSYSTRLDTDSILVRQPNNWQIIVANSRTNIFSKIYQSPNTLAGGTEPNTSGGFNLNWMNNQQLVFLSYEDKWPHLYSISTTGGKTKCLTQGNYMVEFPKIDRVKQWIYFSANKGTDKQDIDRRHLFSVDTSGNIVALTSGNSIEAYPTLLSNDDIGFLQSDATMPSVPTIISQKKEIKHLITPATTAFSGKLIQPKQIIFSSPDGVSVHAQLFLPKTNNKKIPVVIFVHGGPDRQMLLGWHYSSYYSNCYAINQYLATHGIAVLSVNYRCGIGYGFDFDEPENVYTQGASEYTDILTAAKWLQKQDFVDTKRIGIYGGSYGGYLTALALSKNSDIFCAGVDIHGVHEHAADEENYRQSIAPDAPLAVEKERKSFAMYYVKNWKSPVLLIHGDDDRNVDFSQSIDLSRAFLKYHIPFEYLVIPDDTHHWMNDQNETKVNEATVEFLERKLLDK